MLGWLWCRRASGSETYQVPPFVPEPLHLVLCHDGPNALWNRAILAHGLLELKLQLDCVRDHVVQLDEAPRDLVKVLEGVMARSESKDGVERGEAAPSGREREEVAVPISMALRIK